MGNNEEAFGGATLSSTVIICRSAIPVIGLLFLLAFHFVSQKAKGTEDINVKACGFPCQPFLYRSSVLFQW